MKKYSFEDYNDNNVLKVHWPLFWILVYLLKHYWLAFIPMLKNLPGIGIIAVDLIPSTASQFIYEHSTTMPLLLSCIPVMVVSFAAYKRQSSSATQGGEWIRWIWKQGRELLLATTGLEMGIIGGYLWFGIKDLNEMILIILYLDLIILIYLVRSKHVKDVFSEFPQEDDYRWEQACQENTIRAYQGYVSTKAAKKYEADAHVKIDDLTWNQTCEKDTLEAYRHYLDTPLVNKRHSYEARQRWETLLKNREDMQHESI